MLIPPKTQDILGAPVEWPAPNRSSTGVIYDVIQGAEPRLLSVAIMYLDGSEETHLLECVIPYIISSDVTNELRTYFVKLADELCQQRLLAARKKAMGNPKWVDHIGLGGRLRELQEKHDLQECNTARKFSLQDMKRAVDDYGLDTSSEVRMCLLVDHQHGAGQFSVLVIRIAPDSMNGWERNDKSLLIITLLSSREGAGHLCVYIMDHEKKKIDLRGKDQVIIQKDQLYRIENMEKMKFAYLQCRILAV